MTRPEAAAYSYGCPYWADLPEAGIDQLRLANQLWNRCSEAWQQHEAAKMGIWCSVPEIAAAQQALDEAEETVGKARSRIRQSRMRDRSTVPRDADKAALDDARAAAETARTARDNARNANRACLRDQFAAAKTALQAAVNAAHREAKDAGLGWGTADAIAGPGGRFDRAVKKVEEARAAGLPATIQFRRFDATGTLTVVLMRSTEITEAEITRLTALTEAGKKPGEAGETLVLEGFPQRPLMITAKMMNRIRAGRPPQPRAGDPRRSPALLASGGGKWANVATLAPWADPAAGRPKGNARHGTLRMRIGRAHGMEPVDLEVPVVLDRYLPADADVFRVTVTRFREGPQFRLRVSAGFRQPAQERVPGDGGQVAVRLSWRAAGGGWVTVAHVGAPRSLPPVPAGAREVVRLSADRRSAEVMYPPAWRTLLDRDADIASIRAQNLDILRRKVTAVLREDPELTETLGVTPAAAEKWRAPRRFARLAARCPQTHPLKQVLDDWRKRDVHLWAFEDHERAQVLGHRNDAYRCVAKWLCESASGIVVDGTELADLKRRPREDREDPEAARGARRLLHQAAPGTLRAAIQAAAGKRGLPVTTVTAVNGTGKGHRK